MKFKDFVGEVMQKFVGSRAAEWLGFGKVDDLKYPYMVQWLFSPNIGIPRGVDTRVMRDLGNTVFYAQCKRTLIDEIASIDWDIVPCKGFEDKFNEEIKNDIKVLFEQPNKDDNYNIFTKKILNDVYDLDAGVIVKVFSDDDFDEVTTSYTYDVFRRDAKGELMKTEKGAPRKVKRVFDVKAMRDPSSKDIKKALKQDKPQDVGLHLISMYAGDGASFLIQGDPHGRLLEKIPTYFQFSFVNPATAPLAFWKREISYLKMNPRSDSMYGWSPIQSLMMVLEALNNAVRFNKKFYEEFAIPSGIISFKGMLPNKVKKIKDNWKKEMKGQPHKLLFSSNDIKFLDLVKNAREMEWLEGQKFYQQIVMALLHVPQSELGYTAEVKYQQGESQSRVFVRKGIIPMLKLLKSKYDNDIISEFYLSRGIPVECEFKFFHVDIAEEAKEESLWVSRLKDGRVTINEWRIDQGLDPVPWGEEPFKGSTFGGFNPFQNQMQEVIRAEGKSAGLITENVKEVKDYDEFLSDYYADLEVKVLNSLKRSGVIIAKSKDGVKKSLGSFIRSLIQLFSEVKLRKGIRPIVKADFIKGIEVGESQTGVQVGFQEKFNPYLEVLTEEQINGYVLADGKRWFGIKGVNEQIKNKIHQEVMDGLNAREGFAQISDRIKGIFKDAKGYESMRIARTEGNRLINQGTNAAYVESGISGKKVWLSAIDARTSDVCKRLDGQEVMPHETFNDPLTGEAYHHPPAHPNCRSTIVFKPDE